MPTLEKALGSFALILSLGVTAFAPAQAASVELHGSWTATEGSNRTFWGTWTAEVSADKPNTAEGSWALLNEGGQILLEGTWAANKTRLGWQGAWATRTLAGQSLSGTWSAEIAGSNGKTLKQMLEWTLDKDIRGSWHSGHDQGQWRLKSFAPASPSR